jgi:hypothetical protein
VVGPVYLIAFRAKHRGRCRFQVEHCVLENRETNSTTKLNLQCHGQSVHEGQNFIRKFMDKFSNSVHVLEKDRLSQGDAP